MSLILRFFKRNIAFVITRDYVGRVLAWVYKDQIPGKYGQIITTSNPKITNMAKASIYWGIYEGAEQRFVNQYLPKDMDVVELGGSIGVISSLIRKSIDINKRLVIVEADKNLIPSIYENVSTNNPDKKCNVLHGAISYSGADYDGNIFFYDSPQNTGGNKYSSRLDSAVENMISVPSVSLSEVLKKNNINKFSLVSDIEGAESEILEFDKKSLEKCDFIIIELHRTESSAGIIDIPSLLSKLKKLGFKVLDSDGAAVFVLSR
jgi:FkbM family methyltransferase